MYSVFRSLNLIENWNIFRVESTLLFTVRLYLGGKGREGLLDMLFIFFFFFFQYFEKKVMVLLFLSWWVGCLKRYMADVMAYDTVTHRALRVRRGERERENHKDVNSMLTKHGMATVLAWKYEGSYLKDTTI